MAVTGICGTAAAAQRSCTTTFSGPAAVQDPINLHSGSSSSAALQATRPHNFTGGSSINKGELEVKGPPSVEVRVVGECLSE